MSCFAFDETREEDDVYRMSVILKGVRAARKRVFVLIGNEPKADCLRRIEKVIEWGCEPFAQPQIALNAKEKYPLVRYDWTEAELQNMARWTNRWYWRKMPFSAYRQFEAD